MHWPAVDDDTPEEVVAAEAATWTPLVASVRELVDACVTTAVDDAAELAAARRDVEAALARLRAASLPRTLGQIHAPAGRRRPWGNPVIGVRNPMAPPVSVTSTPEGRATASFTCGAAYEGPPGLVHGGVVSMLLDQMLGHAVAAGGRPGMTGTLTVVYRHGTPLGPLSAEAWIDRSEGVKTWASAHLRGPDGVTAEATGVFILPRALRERLGPP